MSKINTGENTKKYICITKCPHLDKDNIIHCDTTGLHLEMLKKREREDYCPCGNIPEWELVENSKQ
jgi:hypothetical protein